MGGSGSGRKRKHVSESNLRRLDIRVLQKQEGLEDSGFSVGSREEARRTVAHGLMRGASAIGGWAEWLVVITMADGETKIRVACCSASSTRPSWNWERRRPPEAPV